MPNTFDDLNARIEELEFLQNLDRELQRQLDLDHVLAITLDWAMRRSAADTGLIARVRAEDLQVLRVAGYAYQYASKLTREPIPLNTGILGRAVASRNPVYMAYTNTSAKLDHIYDKSRSHFAVPLIAADEVFGVLHLESRHPAHFNAEIRRFITFVAGRASLSIHNADVHTRIARSEQLKADMIQMVAHDLRNPLNTVINGTTILKRLREQMPDALGKVVLTIEQAAHDMRSLIEELLTLEKIESGAEIEAVPINMKSILEDAINRVSGDAKAKAQDISIQMPDEAIVIQGEFAHIRQAMVNLISNAIKYTPRRGKIDIKIEHYSQRAFFDVTDNGYGIAPERQKKLFQRFYRAHQPGTEHIQGTGLGLSLVKAIVERSSGEVWFKSESGEGSTFGFWLPMVEDETLAEIANENTNRAMDSSMFAVQRYARKSKTKADKDTKPLTTDVPLEDINDLEDLDKTEAKTES